MRLYCLFFSFIIVIGILHSQNTFSKRLNFQSSSTVLTGLSILPSKNIFVSGLLVDNSNNNFTTLVSFEINQGGEIIHTNEISSTPWKIYAPWGKSKTINNQMFFTGQIFDTIGSNTTIFKYSETLEESIFIEQTTFLDSSFYFRYNDLLEINNSLYTFGYDQRKSDYHVIPVWAKYNINGGLIDYKLLEIENRIQLVYCGIKRNSNEMLMGGLMNSDNHTWNDFEFRSRLWALDTLGNLLWHWASPIGELQQGVYGMVTTEDNGLIIATAIGTEIPINSESSESHWDCYIYKLDANLEKSWGTYFRHNFANEFHKFRQLIEVADGSGYVAVGTSSAWYGGYNIEEENVFDWGGIIAKVSPEGDSLWSRIIIHPNLPTFVEYHKLYDVTETSDGHFVMVGESRHQDTSPSQQGWLLKVDEWGCLVPGCHLISNTEEVIAPEMQLLIYPNPANNLLNVYLGPGKLEQLTQLCIIDTQGRIVQKRAISGTDATYILDVSNLSKGQYFVQLYQAGKPVNKGKGILIQ